jgi:hypothetical protein
MKCCKYDSYGQVWLRYVTYGRKCYNILYASQYTLNNDPPQYIWLMTLGHNLECLQFLLFGVEYRYKEEVATAAVSTSNPTCFFSLTA